MKTVRWETLKKRRLSPKRIREIEGAAKKEAIAMTLRELRELSGKTQQQIARMTHVAQSELSRLERRDDYRLSTLKRYVEALGGEVEITAVFGRRKIRVRAA